MNIIGPSIFCSVLALFYLSLAIITGIMGKPVLNKLSALKAPGDSLVSIIEKTGEEVGLESTLHKAFKAIIITDIVGFILAAIAALLSAI